MENEIWKILSNPFTTRAVLYQLRSKSFDRPTAIVFKTIAQPIVQTVIPSLPELDRIWLQAITTPMLWSGNMIAKTFFEFGKPGFKNFTSVDHLPLVGSPRSQPASQRPTLEILFRLCGGNFRNIAFDAYLP